MVAAKAWPSVAAAEKPGAVAATSSSPAPSPTPMGMEVVVPLKLYAADYNLCKTWHRLGVGVSQKSLVMLCVRCVRGDARLCLELSE